MTIPWNFDRRVLVCGALLSASCVYDALYLDPSGAKGAINGDANSENDGDGHFEADEDAGGDSDPSGDPGFADGDGTFADNDNDNDSGDSDSGNGDNAGDLGDSDTPDDDPPTCGVLDGACPADCAHVDDSDCPPCEDDGFLCPFGCTIVNDDDCGVRCGDGVLSATFTTPAGNEMCDDGVNDGGFGSCTDDCSGFGRYCDDGVTAAPKTDAGCGGPLCEPCDATRSCLENRDCHSHTCDGGFCMASATPAAAIPFEATAVTSIDLTDLPAFARFPLRCKSISVCPVDEGCTYYVATIFASAQSGASPSLTIGMTYADPEPVRLLFAVGAASQCGDPPLHIDAGSSVVIGLPDDASLRIFLPEVIYRELQLFVGSDGHTYWDRELTQPASQP